MNHAASQPRSKPFLALAIASCLALSSILASPMLAQESPSVAFSLGAFNFNKSPTVLEGGVEYRHPIDVWKLAIAGGLFANVDGAFWVFGGLRRDFHLGGPWLITPAFGLTLYEKGDSKDLGGVFEFRSALEVGYQWPNRHRVAFGISHLSNAGIYDLNPGANSLIVSYSLPLK